MQNRLQTSLTRRSVAVMTCQLAGGLVGAALLKAEAFATPTSMEAAIGNVVGSAHVTLGKVAIEVPPVVENGNAVPITISVDSPMTRDAYVSAIHVFNQKNPQPHVIVVRL